MSNTFITCRKGKPTTTSLDIAEAFDKQHRKILRDIRALECSEEFSQSNFGLRNHIDDRGKRQPHYIVTRDGFMLLCMGYTGARAMAMKEAYITAFSQMEQQIIQHLPQLQATERTRLQLLERFVANHLYSHELCQHWKRIKRYSSMGLSMVEVAKLIGRGRGYVSKQIQMMEACGLIIPSAKRIAQRKNAQATNPIKAGGVR